MSLKNASTSGTITQLSFAACSRGLHWRWFLSL